MTPGIVDLLVCYAIAFGFSNKLPWLHGRVHILDSLLKCSYCTGFHSGWAGWLILSRGQGLETPDVYLSAIAWAFASSAFCYVMDATTAAIENVGSVYNEFFQMMPELHDCVEVARHNLIEEVPSESGEEEWGPHEIQ